MVRYRTTQCRSRCMHLRSLWKLRLQKRCQTYFRSCLIDDLRKTPILLLTLYIESLLGTSPLSWQGRTRWPGKPFLIYLIRAWPMLSNLWNLGCYHKRQLRGQPQVIKTVSLKERSVRLRKLPKSPFPLSMRRFVGPYEKVLNELN